MWSARQVVKAIHEVRKARRHDSHVQHNFEALVPYAEDPEAATLLFLPSEIAQFWLILTPKPEPGGVARPLSHECPGKEFSEIGQANSQIVATQGAGFDIHTGTVPRVTARVSTSLRVGALRRRTQQEPGTAGGLVKALKSSAMQRDELRALQEPLKERYRDEPTDALVTLKAEGSLGEGVTCSVATGKAMAEAGLHPATGGDGLSLCSGDMLLQALAACAGVTLRAVATSLDIPVRGGSVFVEGDLDFRGTLAVSKEASVGFTDIRLHFDLDSDASEEQLTTLTRLTERYCVVYQTLAGSPKLSLALHDGA